MTISYRGWQDSGSRLLRGAEPGPPEEAGRESEKTQAQAEARAPFKSERV